MPDPVIPTITPWVVKSLAASITAVPWRSWLAASICSPMYSWPLGTSGIDRDGNLTGMQLRSLLTPEIVETFQRDGYVVVPDLLSAEEVEHFEAAVTGAVRRRREGIEVAPLAERSRYQQSFIQCMNLWEDDSDVARLTFHQRVGQAAAELLEVDAVRLWHDQALYKEAGGRETDAHQDHPYWPIAETASVTAWIPLVGSTIASGAMGYVPGSHLVGMRKFVNIFFGEPDRHPR